MLMHSLQRNIFHRYFSASYDGDQFIKEVEVDFVVWELHGRTDFGYTASAHKVSRILIPGMSDSVMCTVYCHSQAGCQSAPQTWEEMMESGLPPSQAWTMEVATLDHCNLIPRPEIG